MLLKVLSVILFLAVTAYGIWFLNQNHAQPSLNTAPPQPSTTPLPLATPSVKKTTVEISEQTLNSEIKSILIGHSLGTTPLGEATITDVHLTINPGYILLAGVAKNGPITPNFNAKATLTLIDNLPKLNLSELTLNNLPLPQIIADQLTSVLQSKVNDIFQKYNFKLESITMEAGKIIIVGEK